MSRQRRIGILTGGGDVPGLNSVIKSVVYRSTETDYEVLGIRRGWMGLMCHQPGGPLDPQFVVPLNRANTRGIERRGGTMLHTSRLNPLHVRKEHVPPRFDAEQLRKLEVGEGLYDFTPVVLDHIADLGLDYLIVIGGDGTLIFPSTLEQKGVQVIGIPKTMDNDVPGTEYAIGFATAITRAKDLITRQRTTLGSHERIGIFRIFGRDSGFTALYTAYVTAGRCVIPEVVFDLERLIELLLEDKRTNPSSYAFVIVSEGAAWQGQVLPDCGYDVYGHKRKADVGQALAEEMQQRTGEEVMVSDLTYDLRSGDPDALDQIVSITLANVAVDLIRDGLHGRLAAVQGGKYTHAPLPDPKAGPRKVDVDKMFNSERCRPNYAGRIGSPLLLSCVDC
jgi:ATP-dependent phosphofructokinase / diphosphate-dependent phosphofructokinase